MGSYYVPNPNQYTQVAAYSVARDNTIPSGVTTVLGIYYIWNTDSGFTGNGWMTHVSGGPTAMFDFKGAGYSGVEEYVAKVGNLDAVFQHWMSVYNSEGWLAFTNEVGSSCMDVVRPT